MTPEQKLELDNIVKQTIKIEDIAASLSDIEQSIFLSEEYIRQSLTPPPPPVPTYQLNASSSEINEGDSVMFTLKTTGLTAGTKVLFDISGTASLVDFTTSVTEFVIDQKGQSSVVFTALNDSLTEGDEFFTVSLRDAPLSQTVVIKDTSITPPPPPPPPIDPQIGKVIIKKLNPNALILPRSYVRDSATYERYQYKDIVDYGKVYLYEFRLMSGSTPRPFRTSAYKLFVDGVEIMSKKFPVSTMIGSFEIDTAKLNLSNGDHLLEIFGEDDETSIPSSLYVKVAGASNPTKMLCMQGSHDCEHNNGLLKYHYVWVPYDYKPKAVPLAKAVREPFNTALGRKSLISEDLVPVRLSDIYRPRITDDVLNTCNTQNYLITSAMQLIPDKALLDGPRGVGTINGVTHCQVGRVGGIYFTEGWRVGHVSTDGTIRTIAGLRSDPIADRNVVAGKTKYKLVGDWSNVPVERRGFHELWGFTFWKKSLIVDESANELPNNGTFEKPHLPPGPVAFVPDSQHNRIIKLQFAKDSHETPVVVTEFITGLNDPWDCVEDNDILYISERLGNKIRMHNAETGVYLGDFLTGPNNLSFANITVSDRKPYAIASLAKIREQKCVLPEGLYIYKGSLYFASQVMQQIYKYDIKTKQLQSIITYPENYMNGYYNKIAVSDGTFGPEGTVFIQGWASNTSNGWPPAFLPDGTTWPYYFGEGPGKVFDNMNYGSAVGVGNGILVFGSSLEGLVIVRKAQPGEPSYKWSEGYKDALDEWQSQGFTLVHGRGGFGHYDIPLPWGVNSKIDYYLTMNGHVKPV